MARYLSPFVIAAAFALPLGSASEALGAEVPAPRPRLESLVEKARKLATRKIAPGSAAETRWKNDIKVVIDDILDWDELTRRSLGRHWKKRSTREKKEFAALLREMIEASYQSRLRAAVRDKSKKPAKVEIEWLEEKVRKNKATSTARFRADKNVAVLGFKLRWSGKRWRVYDVSIDDVSTVRTYRSQFGKIIGQNGFASLIERMRQKTEEIRTKRADLPSP